MHALNTASLKHKSHTERNIIVMCQVHQTAWGTTILLDDLPSIITHAQGHTISTRNDNMDSHCGEVFN